MTRFNRILTRLLFPGTVLAALSVPIAAALLIYVFSFPDVSAPLAYAAYAVSAYSLTVVCAGIFGIAVYMVCRAAKMLGNTETEETA